MFGSSKFPRQSFAINSWVELSWETQPTPTQPKQYVKVGLGLLNFHVYLLRLVFDVSSSFLTQPISKTNCKRLTWKFRRPKLKQYVWVGLGNSTQTNPNKMFELGCVESSKFPCLSFGFSFWCLSQPNPDPTQTICVNCVGLGCVGSSKFSRLSFAFSFWRLLFLSNPTQSNSDINCKRLTWKIRRPNLNSMFGLGWETKSKPTQTICLSWVGMFWVF